MSDIQEEQKRLYKKAEENDIKLLQEEINRLNNIINEAINGIKDFYLNDDEYTKYDYTLAYKIYHILKGDNK